MILTELVIEGYNERLDSVLLRAEYPHLDTPRGTVSQMMVKHKTEFVVGRSIIEKLL